MCLIKNDERIVKRPSAHICQRSNFNNALFEHLLISLNSDHLIKRIVKRSEIRIYLALQIAR